MKTILPIILCTFFIAATSYAQTSENLYFSQGEKEITVDVSSIFSENRNTTVFYRKYKEKTATRFGGGIGINQMDAETFQAPPNESGVKRFSVQANLRAGVQRNFTSDRYNFYIGIDLSPGYSFTDRVDEQTRVNDLNQNADVFVRTNKLQQHTVSFGVSPLLGGNYRLNERVALGFEANFSVAYYIELYNLDITTTTFDSFGGDVIESISSSSSGSNYWGNANLNSLSAQNLSVYLSFFL